MHIGIDFDNTIVCYNDVFYQAAIEQNLIPLYISPSKTSIRDYFRSLRREDDWTRLQGYVYGTRMDLAHPFAGIELFFRACHTHQIKLSIVSHKTHHPYLGPQYDLHMAARQWLEKQPFYSHEVNVHFELTLNKKLKRIKSIGCDVFIDDLPELLREPMFPKETQRILFDPENCYTQTNEWTKIASWSEMLSILQSYMLL